MKNKYVKAISILLLISTLLFVSPIQSLAANALTGIEFVKSATTLAIGKSEMLRIKSIPSGMTVPKIAWSTSDKKVATVSSTGAVKGVGSGWAIITAKSNKFMDKCLVKVTKTNRFNITKSSASTIVNLLKKDIPTIENVIVYSEYDDPNELMGEPGEYISKANLSLNKQ